MVKNLLEKANIGMLLMFCALRKVVKNGAGKLKIIKFEPLANLSGRWRELQAFGNTLNWYRLLETWIR
jgi:hypothetical protein